MMNYTPLDLNQFQRKKNKRSLIKIFFILVLILFFGFVFTFTAVAYTDFRPPFVSSEVAKRIKVYFAFLPILPKTKEQVVLASLYKTSKIKSFAIDSSGALTISLSGIDFNLDVNSKSFFDYFDRKKNKVLYEGEFIFSYLGSRYDFGLKTISIGEDTYIKIVRLSDSLTAYLQQYFSQLSFYSDENVVNSFIDTLTSNWIKVEGKPDTSSRQELNKGKESELNVPYNIASGFLTSDILETLNFSKDKESYKLYRSFSGVETVEFFKKFLLKEGKVLTNSQKETFEKLKQSIKEFRVSVEIGKKDYYVKDVAFVLKTEFDSDKITGSLFDNFQNLLLGNLKFEFALTFSLSGINERREIERPERYKNFQEIYLEFQRKFMNNYNSTLNSDSSRLPYTIRELVLKLEEYKITNGSYPESLNKYFLTNSDPLIEEKVNSSKIVYIVSNDKKNFIIYAPYNSNMGENNYLVYTNSKGYVEVLNQVELSERIDSIKKNVLGVFFRRLVPSN